MEAGKVDGHGRAGTGAAEEARLRAENVALRGDLAMARAQRDEANRDNDALRAELTRVKQAHEDEIAEYTAAASGYAQGAVERE